MSCCEQRIETSFKQQILCSQRRVDVNRHRMNLCYTLITTKFSEFSVIWNGFALFLNNLAVKIRVRATSTLDANNFTTAEFFAHNSLDYPITFRKLHGGGNTVSYFRECCFSAIVTFAHKPLRHGSRPNPPPWGVTPPFVNKLWRCPLDFAKSRPTGGPVLRANTTICGNTSLWHHKQIASLIHWHFFHWKLHKLYFCIVKWNIIYFLYYADTYSQYT